MRLQQKLRDQAYHLSWFLFIFQVNNIVDCIFFWTSNDNQILYFNLIEIGIYMSFQMITAILIYLKKNIKKKNQPNFDFHYLLANITLIILLCEFQILKKRCQDNKNQVDFGVILGIFIQSSMKFIKNAKLRMSCFGIELIYITFRLQEFLDCHIQRLLLLTFGLLIYYGWNFYKESKNKDKNEETIDKSNLNSFWVEALKENNEEGIAVFDSQKKLLMKNEKIRKIINFENNIEKKLLNFTLKYVSLDSDSEVLLANTQTEFFTELMQLNIVEVPRVEILRMEIPRTSKSIVEHFKRKSTFSLSEIMNDITDFTNSIKLPKFDKNTKNIDSKKIILIFDFINGNEDIQIKEEFHRARLILTIYLKNKKVDFFFIRIQIYLDRDLLLISEKKAQNSKIFFVSHEMRTPLNCIVSMLQMLKYEIKEELITEFITPSIISCNFLLYLVQDLLDMAEMESEKFVIIYEEFDVRALIIDIMKLFTIQIKAKNAEITKKIANQIPETIISDHRRIRQILINLVGNSLKFLPKVNGKITIELDLDTKNLSNIRFLVHDNGIGIREEDKNKLFQAFGKIQNDENKKMNSSGVGLGLMISNNLAINLHPNKTHGLMVESQYGVGTTFSFVLEDKTEVFNLREYESFIKPNELYQGYLNQKKFLEGGIEELGQMKWQINKNPIDSIKGDFESEKSSFIYSKKNSKKENNSLRSRSEKNQKSHKSQKSQRSWYCASPFADSSIKSFCDVFLSNKNNEEFDFSHHKLSKIKEINLDRKCLCPEMLIVDDNAFNILALKKQLESFKFIVDCAIDGEEAINLVAEYYASKKKCCRKYNIIFMDIEMPGKNGYETSKEIRDFFEIKQDKNYSYIIGCSAHIVEAEVEKHKKFGMDEFVTKPLMKEKLIMLLGKYLNFDE